MALQTEATDKDLLSFLSDTNDQIVSNKILANFTIAAINIGYLESSLFSVDDGGVVTHTLPQLPDKFEDAKANFILIQSRDPTSKDLDFLKSIYNEKRARIILNFQIATLLSPLMLLIPKLLHKSKYSRYEILSVRSHAHLPLTSCSFIPRLPSD